MTVTSSLPAERTSSSTEKESVSRSDGSNSSPCSQLMVELIPRPQPMSPVSLISTFTNDEEVSRKVAKNAEFPVPFPGSHVH